MSATAERIEHVKELRRAHFHLGFDTDTNYKSVAKAAIPPVKSAKVRPMTAVVERDAQLQQQNNIPRPPQLQKGNFHLGNDQVKLQSIAQSDFQRPQSAQISKLSEETKKDLRKSHFQLGYHDFSKESEYKQEFVDTKNYCEKASNEEIRKHHHDFGDKNNYYSSIYDQMHNKAYDKNYIGQSFTKQQILDQVVELRKTNLNVGSAQVQYQSQSNAIHQQLPISQTRQGDTKQLVKNSHLQFGTDTLDYKSQTKQAFTGEKQVNGAQLNEETKKDLRATHFTVGNDGPNYQSAYKSQFKEDRIQNSKAENPHLQANHFNIADVNANIEVKDHYNSSYNKSFTGENEKIKPVQIIDKSKNVHIGFMPIGYQSEAKGQFQDPKSRPSALSKEQQADLRNHHYKFGDDQNIYKSQSKDIHSGQNGQPSKLDDALMKDIRATHFNFGFAKQDFKTHHNEYGSKQGPPNRLPPDIAHRIRAHAQH